MVQAAFQALRVVVDDLLSVMPPRCLRALLHCVAAFAGQTADVNASLTAIGLLWAVGDFALTQCGGDGGGEAEAAAAAAADFEELEQQGVSSPDQASLAAVAAAATASAAEAEAAAAAARREGESGVPRTRVWAALAWWLRALAVDARSEVRTCALQTLASAVVSHGRGLRGAEWRVCLARCLLPTLEQVRPP
ncbi:hypothetical protein [Brevundimonas sp.]|uniref:hypothetical protein n=1 Tax=Brevundimonas sp. TaxID=1871086 RepID=UPI00391A7B2B